MTHQVSAPYLPVYDFVSTAASLAFSRNKPGVIGHPLM